MCGVLGNIVFTKILFIYSYFIHFFNVLMIFLLCYTCKQADLRHSLRSLEGKEIQLQESRASLREKEAELHSCREDLLETELENAKLRTSIARLSPPRPR